MGWENLHQKILEGGHHMDWGSVLTQGVWPYLQSAQTILDLGCGQGNDSLRLALDGRHVVGLDISADALKHAETRAKAENLDVRFVQANITEGLPFSEDSFDAVLANLSLHYFSTEASGLIVEEVRRILKLTGVFCLHLNALQEGQARRAAEQVIQEIEPNFYLEKDGITRRYFSAADLEVLFRDWSMECVEALEVMGLKGNRKYCWRVVAKS